MITWMQKHRKYMIVIMWIAVITFVGAGAVNWGGANYSSSASSVAKVGSIEISNNEFSRSRANAFEYYRSQFKDEFDEKMAKKVKLNEQVLSQLTRQALLLNMAKSFDLTISDEATIKEIQKSKEFQRDGKFNLKLYKDTLKRVRFENADYEQQVNRSLLLSKITEYVKPVYGSPEINALLTIQAITNKIKYKILSSSKYKIKVDQKSLREFWSFQKNNFLTPEIMNIAYITQKSLPLEQDNEKIQTYYNKNKRDFLDDLGKILAFNKAKPEVVKQMRDQATEEKANYLKVAWKNFDKSDKNETHKSTTFNLKITNLSFDINKAPISTNIVDKLKLLPNNKPYLKAEKVNDDYIVYKLLSISTPRVQTFQEAKSKVVPLYIASEKKKRLQAEVIKAEKLPLEKTSPFFTSYDTKGINGVNEKEMKIVSDKLFKSNKKKGTIAISNTKVLLYDIREQKLLLDSKPKMKDIMKNITVNLKKQTFSEALVKVLNKTYKTENYLK